MVRIFNGDGTGDVYKLFVLFARVGEDTNVIIFEMPMFFFHPRVGADDVSETYLFESIQEAFGVVVAVWEQEQFADSLDGGREVSVAV